MKRRYKVSLRRDVVQFTEVEVEADGEFAASAEAGAVVRSGRGALPIAWTDHLGEAVVIGIEESQGVRKQRAV